MRQFCLFTLIFLFMGICFVSAQDLIVLKDGSMIEAKVTEISQTEIRYKRFDHLDGPTIVISTARVLSIRYQNGTQEIIKSEATPEQKKTQTKSTTTTTAMDTDKFIFGFNANPGGALNFSGPGGGSSLCLEFGKGSFNSEVNIIFPWRGGIGSLTTFNGFWHKSYGGFYLGGGIGYIYMPDLYTRSYTYQRYNGYNSYTTDYYSHSVDGHILTIGLNIGWKFVTRSGIYFRTGACAGVGLDVGEWDGSDKLRDFYLKPDLSIGYCFK